MTNNTLVGVPGFKVFNGVETVLASNSLSIFQSTMNELNLTSYDYAVGITT